MRVAQRKYDAAVDLLRHGNKQAPNAGIVYALAQALEQSGKSEQAKSAYVEFERDARNQINTFGNFNRELILYYAERGKPAEALDLARHEITVRNDVLTVCALAFCHAQIQHGFSTQQDQTDLSIAKQ